MLTNSDTEIPVYSLFIHPQDLQELRRDIWSDDPVPGKLKVGKAKYIVDITYRGAHTREFRKKSYNIFFVKPGTFFGGREIHLNAEYIDPSILRNKLSLDFFNAIGTLSPNARYVLLKINGTFMGVYLQLESVDDLFLRRRRLPLGPIYYANNDDANFSLISPLTNDVKESLEDGYKKKIGTEMDDGFLRELIYKVNTVLQSDFDTEIIKYVNIEKYLIWLAGVVCTQNFDGFIHNYALYRNSETGLFEMIPWDYDGTWGRDCHGELMEYDYIPIEGYNTLTARILDIPKFRRSYKQILEEVLEKWFNLEYLEPKIDSLYRLLRPHILLDPFKREAIDMFDSEPEYILKFIVERNKYLLEHLSDLD